MAAPNSLPSLGDALLRQTMDWLTATFENIMSRLCACWLAVCSAGLLRPQSCTLSAQSAVVWRQPYLDLVHESEDQFRVESFRGFRFQGLGWTGALQIAHSKIVSSPGMTGSDSPDRRVPGQWVLLLKACTRPRLLRCDLASASACSLTLS